ncbi:hypothetical protein [Streptomyces sp. AC555_RSS877]|uniref:hypothetical protein n=1 Tax=Streptomyces sp. AC555_RSS877 TaxID=2823688 RepID=UPI001C2800C4|nr:hypothetical protein [Streptomyces sp. AC555_RSS877]
MIAEAIDTVVTLGVALLAWIVLLAAVATLAGWTVVVTVACACRGLWRGVAGVVALVRHSEVPASPPESHKPADARTRPSWAHIDKEAA